MADPLIVSVSGIRGIVGTSLTPNEVMRFAAAFGAPLVGRIVAVARDGRTTATCCADAVKAGLAAVGCEVVDLGIAATPTIGYYVKTSAPAAACRSPPVTIAGMERAQAVSARKDSCCLPRPDWKVVEAYEAPAREVRFVGRSEEGRG